MRLHARSLVRPAAALAFAALFALAPLAGPAHARDLPAQSVTVLGTTHSRAQALSWIDETSFAVGRWDGTIAVFRLPRPGEFGPVVVQAMAAPSGRGVEMLKTVDRATLVSSDGVDRMALWTRDAAGGSFVARASMTYDAAFGAANSAAVVDLGGTSHLVTGHESGYVLLWRRSLAGFDFVAAFDLRSAQPIPSPFALRNIRGLAAWRGDHVVAGSEDGDLVAIKLPEGREVFRTRYNAAAKRGINTLSLAGERLLVANCSVGAADRNIWLYDLSSGRPALRDAENLALDTQRAQVFNFDVHLVGSAGDLRFFSSTEEGLIWQGRLDGDQLVVTGVTRVAPDGGAVLAPSMNGEMVAAAAHQIWLLQAR